MTETKTSSQLDYKKMTFVHPTYRISKVLPQTGSQSVTVGTAGGQETIFEIPINTTNLSRSYLFFTVTPPAGPAGTAYTNYAFQDCAAVFRQIQLYTRSGIYIADLNEVANETKIMWKPDIKLQEYLDYDNFYNSSVAGGGGVGRYLRPSNSLVNSSTKTVLNPFAIRHDNSNSDVNYIEPKYLEPGATAADPATAQPVFNIQFPLNMLKNSIFEVDKDIYFGEIILLRIVWQAGTKIFYLGTSVTNPTTGAAALAGNVSIGSLALYLAVEKNDEITNQMRAQVASGGLNVLIPYTYTYKNALNGTSQTVSLRFNRGNGRRLKKIYHSVFNTTESANTAYDHDNRANAKAQVFYTMLDNQRIQEFNLTTATFDDYLYLQPKLKGSILQSSNMFYYNWVWMEDWTGLDDKTLVPGDTQNLETGLDLSFERKWDFYGVTMTNSNFNHYTFAVTEKMLTISPVGITVI